MSTLKLEHLKHLSLGHFQKALRYFGNLALGHLRHFGSWVFKILKILTVPERLVTWSSGHLMHLSTWALKSLMHLGTWALGHFKHLRHLRHMRYFGVLDLTDSLQNTDIFLRDLRSLLLI